MVVTLKLPVNPPTFSVAELRALLPEALFNRIVTV
jgi:hypothetical protein